MIRDEFKEQKENNVSIREMEKINKMGERSFYTSSLMKFRDLTKAMKFSGIFCIIVGVLILLMVALMYVASGATWRFFVYGSLGLIFFLFGFLWFTIFKGIINKKTILYQEKLKEINDKEIAKKQLAYDTILKRGK